jgi:hypothetical protein
MRVFWVSAAILGSYIAALATPACYLRRFLEDKDRVVMGIDALANGWTGRGIIPELANVALAVGWLSFLANRVKLAELLAVIAMVLGATAPAIFEIPTRNLGIGFCLWMLSHASLLIGSWLSLRSETKPSGKPKST